MNLFSKYSTGLSYADFLARYANDSQKERWKQVYSQIQLTSFQKKLLGTFSRKMPVLCLAGAWCGDCINQCPIFEHFAATTPLIQVRYLNRDEHADVQKELLINAGMRVPVAVFFSEDGFEVARYGERTLSKYRQMMHDQIGFMFDTPVAVSHEPLLAQVTQDWFNEFERVHWLLRLSPRLRQLHGD